MITTTDAPPGAAAGRRSLPGRPLVWAAAAAAVVAFVVLPRAGADGAPRHLQALLPVPPEFPPGWWSLDFADGAAWLMAPTGTNEHIGEVVRFDDQLELGPDPECGDGGPGLYEVVRDGDDVRFEAMGADGCAARQEVLTAGTWRPYAPPPMTTRVPDVRPAEVLATVPVEGEAARLAVTSGSVWVVTVATRSLYRIDPTSNVVVDAVDIDYADRIPGLAAAEDGSLWVSNWLRSTVSRVDATTGEVTATVDVGRDPPGGMAVVDGDVWVANGHDGTVTRVDGSAGAVIESIAVGEPGDGGPQDVAAFEDRVLVSVPRESAIMSIDPRTGEVSRFFTGRMQSRMQAAGDAVWTFEGLDAGWVTRIGADGTADLRIGVGEGRRPRALAATADVVWVLTVGPRTPVVDFELLRIDARSGEVTDRLGVEHLAGRHDVVVDEGGDVWVTAMDAVLRIDGTP